MERVQFQQEQMLAELKDFEEKGLFSKQEIKAIMKKRTAFETALVRRIPKKSDFLRYAEYEMGLEALRRKRVKRLKIQGPPSISDYSLVRRQFQIFERALRKFRADVALWVQYIEIARREGARALAGRISARALQLHPNVAALYVHAAQHEESDPSSRALLQRGLRLNADSIELWVAYVQFELGFVERMRRRWDVLGVQVDEGEDGALEKESDEEGGGEEARRKVMGGAIVEAVIDEAAKAIPKMPLFWALHELLTTYSTPLRRPLLEHLHGELLKVLPEDPAALALHAARFLPGPNGDIRSAEFIDLLRDANEELVTHARANPREVSWMYAKFVEEWCGRDIDPNLIQRLYLTGCLQTVTALRGVSEKALATHIRLLIAGDAPAGRVRVRAAKYTERARESADVWLARLDAEARVGDARSVWAEARRQARGAGREQVWLWGLRGAGPEECEKLLSESITAGEREIHTALLIEYVGRIARPQRAGDVRRVLGRYMATEAFFRGVFGALEDAAEEVVEAVYEGWRRCAGESAAAAAGWAEWLERHGAGLEAAAVRATAAAVG